MSKEAYLKDQEEQLRGQECPKCKAKGLDGTQGLSLVVTYQIK